MNHPVKLFTFGALLFASSVSAQDWGIGFRLGDPSGVTVKHYWSNKAFEVSIGRTSFFARNNFYSRQYERWYERRDFHYARHEFLSYGPAVPVALQLHYLIQNPLAKADGLSWYYGFGGQMRLASYRFTYRYKPQDNNDWVYVNDERVNSLDLGVDGVLGLEYTFPKAPVSIFLDGTLYMELFDDPFLFSLQGGIGVRFRF